MIYRLYIVACSKYFFKFYFSALSVKTEFVANNPFGRFRPSKQWALSTSWESLDFGH